MHPSPGDLFLIDGRASVQFAGDRALTFRIVSLYDRPTYAGWVWLTGYVINRRGQATARREIYVQLAGLRRAPALPGQRGQRSVSTRPYALRNDESDGRTTGDSSRLHARTGAG